MNYLTIFLMASLAMALTWIAATTSTIANTRLALNSQEGETVARSTHGAILLVVALVLLFLAIGLATQTISFDILNDLTKASPSVDSVVNSE
jgi:heme/copper-type cytochrome/quinol oxidase subunit 2